MSPEQVRGQSVDHCTDIFSFGCVLYEMLSGKRAFTGDTAADTITAVLSGDPAPLTGSGIGVSPTLQGIVRRCLEKRAEDRFGSARDVAFALEAITGETEPPPTGLPRESWLARHRLALAGAGIAVAMVAALAIWRPWHAVSRPAASAAGHFPSVLALPCKVYGAPEVAFLTDAVPGTISTLLAQVEGLDTKVPPTSFEVEKVKGDLTTLADLYQVSSFIVTSITTSSGRFALNVQLVDAATRRVRWGKQYEGPREAYNELARQAAEGIRQAVRPAASPVPTSGRPSEAELALREGEYFVNRSLAIAQPADIEAALAAYTRALDLDPKLAIAAARIGFLKIMGAKTQHEVEQGRKQMDAWARRALGIDPHCSEAWFVLSEAEIYATHPDIERGIDYALKALAFGPLNPNAHLVLGTWVSGPGSLSLFVAASLRAFELDSFNAGGGNAAFGLCCLGRLGEALAVVDKAVQAEPDAVMRQIQKGFVLARLGRLQEAERVLNGCKAAAERTHDNSALWREVSLVLAVAQGDTAKADALASAVVSSALEPSADALLIGNAMAFTSPELVRMGRTDDALRLMLRAVEVSGQPPYDWLLVDPDLQRLRGDARFAKVLAASHDGAAMVARALEQARTRGELPAYLNEPLDELLKLLNQKGGTS